MHVIKARKQREQSNLCGKRSFKEVFSNSSILNLPYTKGIGYENERFYDNTPSSSSSLASWNFASVTTKPNTTTAATILPDNCITRKGSNIYKGSDRSFVYRICPNQAFSSSLPNYKRVAPNAFGFLNSSDDGRIKKDLVSSLCDNSSTLITNLKSSTEKEQDRDEVEIEHHKEVPFIDFLGVGVSSS